MSCVLRFLFLNPELDINMNFKVSVVVWIILKTLQIQADTYVCIPRTKLMVI